MTSSAGTTLRAEKVRMRDSHVAEGGRFNSLRSITNYRMRLALYPATRDTDKPPFPRFGLSHVLRNPPTIHHTILPHPPFSFLLAPLLLLLHIVSHLSLFPLLLNTLVARHEGPQLVPHAFAGSCHSHDQRGNHSQRSRSHPLQRQC